MEKRKKDRRRFKRPGNNRRFTMPVFSFDWMMIALILPTIIIIAWGLSIMVRF